MKRLHFIRHAKSSWDDSTLDDHRRPLAPRGIKAARLMAEPIWQAGCPLNRPNAVFSSSAERALQTIQLIDEKLQSLGIIDGPLSIQIDDTLYTFDSFSLLTWCRELDTFTQSLDEVTILGHNPAFESLIGYLTGKQLPKFPTCGYAQLNADIDSWHGLGPNSCQLQELFTPKGVKASQPAN